MGFFDRLFGKKLAAPAPAQMGDDDDIQPTGSQPINGPPEFIRAVDMQRDRDFAGWLQGSGCGRR